MKLNFKGPNPFNWLFLTLFYLRSLKVCLCSEYFIIHSNRIPKNSIIKIIFTRRRPDECNSLLIARVAGPSVISKIIARGEANCNYPIPIVAGPNAIISLNPVLGILFLYYYRILHYGTYCLSNCISECNYKNYCTSQKIWKSHKLFQLIFLS